MESLAVLKRQLDQANAAVTLASLMLDNARVKIQLACPHREVVEADYWPSDYGHSMPPFRVCVVCGFSEEGWGCGYQILASEVARAVTRDEGYRLRCYKPGAHWATPPNHVFIRRGNGGRDSEAIKRKRYEEWVRTGTIHEAVLEGK